MPLPVPPSRSEKSSQRLRQRLREDPTQAEPPSCTDRRGVDLLLKKNGGESWRGHAVGGAEPKPSRAHRRDTTMTLSGAPSAPRKAEPRTEGEKVASPGTRMVTVQVRRHSHNDIHTTIFLLKRFTQPKCNSAELAPTSSKTTTSVSQPKGDCVELAPRSGETASIQHQQVSGRSKSARK